MQKTARLADADYERGPPPQPPRAPRGDRGRRLRERPSRSEPAPPRRSFRRCASSRAAAVAGALLLAPFGFFVKEPGVPSSGFWGASALVLLLLGAFAEVERQVFFAFLGNDTRRLLVGVSMFGAVSALALLCAVRVRPRGRAAQLFLLGPLALLSAVPLLGRRGPERSSLAPPQAIPRTATRSLLVVGLEGVSWELLSRAASEGTLPVFARLLEEGAGGPLGTLAPYDRSALWTTAASGKLPRKHGVVSGGGCPDSARRLPPPSTVPRFRGAASPSLLPAADRERTREPEPGVLGSPRAATPRSRRPRVAGGGTAEGGPRLLGDRVVLLRRR